METKVRLNVTMLPVALAMVALASSTVSAAMTGEQKCLAGRAKAKGKYEQCVDKWLSKLYGGGSYDPTSVAKCRIKYNVAWTKLQGLGTTCAVASRYTDNGTTVTDNLTGLEWEKKTTTVGSGTDFGGDRRDVDNYYTWSAGPPYVESGTAYTDFLIALNFLSFAGANGWRLPTFAELQTILLPQAYPCATSPCIDASFGPTESDVYWSATTSAGDPGSAWCVSFYVGYVDIYTKPTINYVRAVRGGL